MEASSEGKEKSSSFKTLKSFGVLLIPLVVYAVGGMKEMSAYLPQDISGVQELLESAISSSSMNDEIKENRPVIEHILQSDENWKFYKEMTSINGSMLVNDTLGYDVTRNAVRIGRLAQPTSTSQLNMNGRQTTASAGSTHSTNTKSDSSALKTKEPLNIVLFYADDWTMKVLGALNPYVDTPNIDAMADRGMLFTRNCVTTSICWISRNSMSTGVYAAVHKNVKIGHDLMFNKTVPWLDTLFPLLKRTGYYTGLVGKWHAPAPGVFMKDTFNVMQIYYGRHWMERKGERRHVTDLNGEDAIRFLKTRPKKQKFALKVSFFATHAWDGNDPPYQPMNESFALYTDVEIPRPKTATDKHWKQMPWFFDGTNEGRRRWKNRFDKKNYQDKIRNLYRMATEVDAVVGAIIDELKAQGVYDKTMLVFTTDNGNLQGEHGLAEKWYPFEESIRVPLVIQDPRMPKSFRGTRNDEFTLNVDLAPTLLAAAGIEAPSFMQGRDIAQLYLNPEEATKTWRQDFFYEWTQGRNYDSQGHNDFRHIPAVFALIRKDYKYFYWPQTKYEQLFHIEVDAYEEADILNSTAQTTKEALQMMRARYAFRKDWAQSGNPV